MAVGAGGPKFCECLLPFRARDTSGAKCDDTGDCSAMLCQVPGTGETEGERSSSHTQLTCLYMTTLTFLLRTLTFLHYSLQHFPPTPLSSPYGCYIT